MATGIATVGGIALSPGVSRNRRLYTREAIAGMVARAQAKLASGDSIPLVEREEPISSHVMTQLSHHAAEDDSTRIVGRVTSLQLDESGNARFTAEIAPTDAGRTIASLLDTTDGKPPFLRGVSGRMAWLDGARIVRGPDGKPCETGDDLDMLGLDYTHKPGVPNAAVDTFSWTDGGAKNETSERVLIYESVQEATLTAISEETTPGGGEQSCADLGHACCKTTTETAPASPVADAVRGMLPEPPHVLQDGYCLSCAGTATEAATAMSQRGSGLQGKGGPYADPGYQSDRKQRYQLDTKAHARAAWSYVNMARNAKQYTGPQLKKIKSRILAALKKFGINAATDEGWTISAGQVITEAVAECFDCGPSSPQQAGSYSLSAQNGPTSITISSYRLDPAELHAIMPVAVSAVCNALKDIDPDLDGDIDIPGAPDADSDSDAAGESVQAESHVEVHVALDGTEIAATVREHARQHAAENDPADVAEEDDPADAAESVSDPAPEAVVGNNEGGSAMAETTPAAETAPAAAPAFSKADLDAAVAQALDAERAARKARKAARRGAAESAADAPVTEADKASGEVTETEDDKVARMVREKLDAEFGTSETDDERLARKVQEQFDAAVAAKIASGEITPQRKGLVSESAGELNEHGTPKSWGKALHEMGNEEFLTRTAPVVVAHVLGDRAKLIA